MNQGDPAIELLIKSRGANPRPLVTHFGLAAALGLKGDIDGAKTATAELLKVKPEVSSLARSRAYRPWGNPQCWTFYENGGGWPAPSRFPRRIDAKSFLARYAIFAELFISAPARCPCARNHSP